MITGGLKNYEEISLPTQMESFISISYELDLTRRYVLFICNYFMSNRLKISYCPI